MLTLFRLAEASVRSRLLFALLLRSLVWGRLSSSNFLEIRSRFACSLMAFNSSDGIFIFFILTTIFSISREAPPRRSVIIVDDRVECLEPLGPGSWDSLDFESFSLTGFDFLVPIFSFDDVLRSDDRVECDRSEDRELRGSFATESSGMNSTCWRDLLAREPEEVVLALLLEDGFDARLSIADDITSFVVFFFFRDFSSISIEDSASVASRGLWRFLPCAAFSILPAFELEAIASCFVSDLSLLPWLDRHKRELLAAMLMAAAVMFCFWTGLLDGSFL